MTTFLGLVGSLQGLILAFAIASVGGPARRPNRALGSMIFSLAIAVGAITVDHAGLLAGMGPFLLILPLLIEHTATFLFAPALWHYTNLVLGDRPRMPSWVHWVPLIAWSSYLLFYTLGWITWRWLPPMLGVLIYLAGYTLIVATRLWRQGSRAKALIHHVRVLKLVVISLVVLHVAQLLRYLLRDVELLVDIVPLTATGLICLLAVVSFRQSRLFAGLEANPMRRKYAGSNLTTEAASELQARLLATLRDHRPFLNESLTLAELAQRLKVPRAHLSQVINRNLDTNFSELIRRYRVEEAQRLLADPSLGHLTIEAIGYEVGFGSRSGFHTAFKGLKGETPAQARARLSPNTFEDKSTEIDQ